MKGGGIKGKGETERKAYRDRGRKWERKKETKNEGKGNER